MTTETVMVYITCINREQALEISHRLVMHRLVACANIVEGSTSVYRWMHEIQEGKEVLVLAKTLQSKTSQIIAEVCKLHSHEIPCVTVLPITGGNPAYLAWVKKEVS